MRTLPGWYEINICKEFHTLCGGVLHAQGLLFSPFASPLLNCFLRACYRRNVDKVDDYCYLHAEKCEEYLHAHKDSVLHILYLARFRCVICILFKQHL